MVSAANSNGLADENTGYMAVTFVRYICSLIIEKEK